MTNSIDYEARAEGIYQSLSRETATLEQLSDKYDVSTNRILQILEKYKKGGYSKSASNIRNR